MFSIPGMKVVSLTDAAAARIREIMAQAPGEALGLRVGIKKGGCAGMEYTVEIAREIGKGDEVVVDTDPAPGEDPARLRIEVLEVDGLRIETLHVTVEPAAEDEDVETACDDADDEKGGER